MRLFRIKVAAKGHHYVVADSLVGAMVIINAKWVKDSVYSIEWLKGEVIVEANIK